MNENPNTNKTEMKIEINVKEQDGGVKIEIGGAIDKATPHEHMLMAALLGFIDHNDETEKTIGKKVFKARCELGGKMVIEATKALISDVIASAEKKVADAEKKAEAAEKKHEDEKDADDGISIVTTSVTEIKN